MPCTAKPGLLFKTFPADSWCSTALQISISLLMVKSPIHSQDDVSGTTHSCLLKGVSCSSLIFPFLTVRVVHVPLLTRYCKPLSEDSCRKVLLLLRETDPWRASHCWCVFLSMFYTVLHAIFSKFCKFVLASTSLDPVCSPSLHTLL